MSAGEEDSGPAVATAPVVHDERARQIIEAAYLVLGEIGLEGLTVRAILSRTGLARRAFYERFSGKDDLMLAVFEHAIRLAADHFAGAVMRLSHPLDRLRLVVQSIALGSDAGADSDFRYRRGAALSREHLRLAETRPVALQTALSPLLDLIARLLAEGAAAGVIRSTAPQRMAPLIYNLVATTAHTEFLTRDMTSKKREDRERLAVDIWDFCLGGIVAVGREPPNVSLPSHHPEAAAS